MADDALTTAATHSALVDAEDEAALRAAIAAESSDPAPWLALIDLCLAEQRFAEAHERIGQALGRIGESAELHLRAARAYAATGEILGDTRERRIRDGRPGCFANRWLILRAGRTRGRYLCCPPESAFYQVRQALDQQPDLLPAQILLIDLHLRLGEFEAARGTLSGIEDRLRQTENAEVVAEGLRLARACRSATLVMRLASRYAALRPDQRDAVLFDAYYFAANQYALRGQAALYRAFMGRALEIRADDPKLIAPYADSLWRCGRKTDAAAWYEHILTLEPAHAERARMARAIREVRSPIAAEKRD